MPARRPTSPAARRPASRPSGARGGSARPTTTANASVGTASKTPSKGKSAGKGTGTAKGAGKSTGTSTGKGSGARSGKGTASTRRGSRRPAGPAREERRRSRYGLVLPEVLTVRLIVLSVVVLLAVVLLLPTVRAAVQQAHELDRLRTELAENRAERDRLEVELGRWDDRSYVEEQARSRLSFVMPADKVWRVVDPDAAGDDDVDPVTGEAVGSGPVGTTTGPSVPWYQSVWESVQVADGPAAAGDDATGGEPEPGGSPGPTSGG